MNWVLACPYLRNLEGALMLAAPWREQVLSYATCGCCERIPCGRADLHTDSLYRVLRAAVNFDVLAVAPGTPPRFEHTESSRLLMDSHPETIWPMVRPMYGAHAPVQVLPLA